MIQETTIASVANYALALDSAGIALAPLAATPLAALQAASGINCQAIANTAANGGSNFCSRELSLCTNNEQHDGTMTAIVNTLAPAVKEHIRVAQAVVNPVVTALVERIEEVAKYFVNPRVSDLQVKRVSMAAPLALSNLVNVIASFTPTESIYMGALRIFPAQTDEQLLALMQVGNAEVDDVIAKWFYAQNQSEFFRRVWQSFFLANTEPSLRSINYTLDNVNWDTPEGTGIALALFMWCNRLHSSPMENMDTTQGYTLAAYNNYLMDMRAQSARRLTDIIDMQKDRVSSGALVHSVLPAAKTIYVNDAVYLKWLDKEDGSNEILYGVLISGDKVAMAADINERKARYLQVFYDYSQLAKEVELAEWANNMRKAIIDCVSEQICQADISVNAKTLAYDKSRTMVYSLPEGRMRTDLYGVCLELVHALLFPGTASIVILRGINIAKEKDQNLSVREAATISIIRYISIYVASLMKVGEAATGKL